MVVVSKFDDVDFEKFSIAMCFEFQ